eukprot:3788486-Alexandrium_andersonii.AAC.1
MSASLVGSEMCIRDSRVHERSAVRAECRCPPGSAAWRGQSREVLCLRMFQMRAVAGWPVPLGLLGPCAQ